MSESQAAERLGRYQLLEPIGAGPNGSVWRAKVFGVAGLERQFAVKRITAELAASPSSAATLSAAARAYGSLEHPRIARMSEFGVAGGQTFTAVELVTGLDAMRLTADAKIGGTGLPAGGALALVSQIARAVGYAHGRGLTHLGLAPTNVIVTSDGDVKVTDFSILSATLPPRPGEDRRLANRVAYLAPEQLSSEATSAATDVFALGVIAYELVTGQRAFGGDSPAAIVQAVLAGPPPEPQLPRPIVRVLQRCLARSPFERFPDARALADALDAALRVAPVPGTRKDIGALVKATLDRLAAINEGEMSGMLALNVGTGAPEPDASTTEFVRPDVPVAGPPPLVGPRASQPPPRTSGLATPPRVPPASMPAIPPKPTTTMTGLAPPPIPSVAKPPSIPKIPPRGTTPQPPRVDEAARTSPGMRVHSELPTRVAPEPAAQVNAAAEAAIRAASESMRASSEILESQRARGDGFRAPSDVRTPSEPVTISPRRSRAVSDALTTVDPDDLQTRPGPPRDMPTNEMSPLLADELSHASRRSAPDLRLPRAETDDSPELSIESTPEEAPVEFDQSTRVAGPTYPVLAAQAAAEHADEVPARATELSARETDVPSLASAGSTRSMASASSTRPMASAGSTTAMGSAASTMPGGNAGSTIGNAGSTMPMGNAGSTMPLPASSTPMPITQPATTMPGVVPPARSSQTSQPPATRSSQTSQPPATRSSQSSLPSATRSGPSSQPPATRPSQPSYPPAPGFNPAMASRGSGGGLRALLILLVVGGVGAGGYFAYTKLLAPKGAGSGAQVAEANGSASRSNGTNPDTNGGSNLAAAHTGTNPGTNGGSNLAAAHAGTNPDTNGGSNAGSNVADSNPGTNPGSNVAGTNPGSNLGSNVAGSNVAGTNAGSNPGTNGGSNPGTNVAGTNGGSNAAGAHATGTPGNAPQPTGASDQLQIASKPSGARVFIDGADQGTTPVKLAGSTDRHNIALLLPGHDLYVAEIDGHGQFSINLTPVTPSGGRAGIKVLKCKKERYYVFVDGKPTGMLCPTERIHTSLGAHSVEVYDAVTESRQKFDIDIKQDRLSFRVRLE